MKTNNDHIIKKWLSNEVDDESLSPTEKEQARVLKKIDQVLSENKAPDYDVAKALEDFHAHRPLKKGKSARLTFPSWTVAAAASLLLIISVYFVMDRFGTDAAITKIAHRGEQLMFYLPDSSKVWLNAGSIAEYNLEDWSQNRVIELSGEGYFEVKKGSVFQVRTDHGVVTVLGTKFTVYDRKMLFQVHCYEGKVKVKSKPGSEVLTEGMGIMLMDDQLTAIEIPASGGPGWFEKRSEFNSIPLAYVFEELERQFDITIKTEKIDLNQKFTGSFTHDDLEVALKAISLSTGTSYKIKDNKTVLIYRGQ